MNEVPVVGVVEDSASILVVDDNPLIVNVLRSLLAANEYVVYSSGSGKEALELLEQKAIDIIICDVMMPEMDGYSLHKAVRGNPQYSHIPFVFLTALGSSDEIKKGKEIGADDYIVKPFNPQDLLSVVKGKVVRSRGLRSGSDERYEHYRKRVIHTLSHEFRTPLVAINTGAELLLERDGCLSEGKAHSLIEAISRGGRRLERLVSDFMLLQQLEAGIAERLFNDRACERPLGDVVESYADACCERLTEGGFKLVVENMCRTSPVLVYEPQIHDILNRLTDNAVKFSGEAKEIELVSYPRSGEAAIEVRDRGLGIDVDRVKEAVDVFGQINRERLEQQGGGLGLAIANRYLKIHGGYLEFERRKGGGSVVTVVLPVVEK